jgi:hypothetical protein
MDQREVVVDIATDVRVGGFVHAADQLGQHEVVDLAVKRFVHER